MDKTNTRQTIMQGKLIECTAEEYPGVRKELQTFAGESIDNGQSIYAQISLNEVKRLDLKFSFMG